MLDLTWKFNNSNNFNPLFLFMVTCFNSIFFLLNDGESNKFWIFFLCNCFSCTWLNRHMENGKWKVWSWHIFSAWKHKWCDVRVFFLMRYKRTSQTGRRLHFLSWKHVELMGMSHVWLFKKKKKMLVTCSTGVSSNNKAKFNWIFSFLFGQFTSDHIAS